MWESLPIKKFKICSFNKRRSTADYYLQRTRRLISRTVATVFGLLQNPKKDLKNSTVRNTTPKTFGGAYA